MKIALLSVGTAVAAGLISTASTMAATVTFGSPTAIGTADTTLAAPRAGDTLIGAVTFDGGGGQTVVTLSNSSTVTFKDDKATGAIATVKQAGGEGGAPGGNAYSPSTGNTDFNSVLSNFAYDGNPTIATINSLTPGVTYDVLLFASDDRDCCGGRTVQFGDGNGNTSSSFSLSSNQYVLGTFTATGATQDIQSIGVGQTQSNFNDLVLFQQTPEPASLGLIAMPTIALLARRRGR